MSQSARLGLAFRAMTLHRLNDPAAFGYDYGYGIQLRLTVQAAVPHLARTRWSSALSQQSNVSFMNLSKPWKALTEVFHSTTQDRGAVCIISPMTGIMAELYLGSDLAVSLLGRKADAVPGHSDQSSMMLPLAASLAASWSRFQFSA